ncbi:hypothetical protein [Kamptonema sp. UHCC 0994]|uniref:hypothetical protein n=1 Tax=Kamptonema sp. UHCC 0994 TaxID=3031329 RepID=UPI0023BA0A12|nr:hypothetical protein [Kamptonema sp. UHCC 0994]MDF0553193.1 hypothetical protein [Kamptonema sp. UHCC 0994]
MPTPKKPVEVDVGGQPKKIWYRYQLRKAMRVSEPTFKRRLMLLQEECPEFGYLPYVREFSNFQAQCLLTLEAWVKEANYCIDSVRKRLAEEGLPTHEYNRPNN